MQEWMKAVVILEHGSQQAVLYKSNLKEEKKTWKQKIPLADFEDITGEFEVSLR